MLKERSALCRMCKGRFVPKYNAQRFCSVVCSNRFNLNNKSVVCFPIGHNEDLAELFGVLLGDGSVTHYYTKIYLNIIADKGYPLFIYRLAKKLFKGASVSRFERPVRGTHEVQISSRDVSDYLFRIGFDPQKRNIPEWISRNENFTRAAIRGLFDTEGSVGIKYFEGKRGKYFYKQLTFTNKNRNLLLFMSSELTKMGYSPTINAHRNIYISNAKDIERYTREIGSNNPKLTKKLKLIVIGRYRYKKNNSR